MHIAICDDEQSQLQHLQALVNEFDPGIDVSVFISSGDLLTAAETQSIDIVLLDIEMSGINGFEAAKRLIKTDYPPLIIFVTNSDEYMLSGYGVAFRYLQKPVDYAKLSDVLAYALEAIAPKKISLTLNGKKCILTVNKITHIEAFGHNLYIHTKSKDYCGRMKLGEIEALLPATMFSSPHKGIVVNLEYVDTVKNKILTLTGGSQLPISRRQKQEFERALSVFARRR